MRRFLIQQKDISESTVSISGSEAAHMQKVLRLTKGRQIELVDDTGCLYLAEIKHISPEAVDAAILEKTTSQTETPIRLMVAQALLKDRKMDDIVRQLTELGVSVFFPFMSERSIARPDAKRLNSRMERWKKIAKESVKQCKRTLVPEIGPALSFEQALDSGKHCDLKIVFWENGVTRLNRDMMDHHNRRKEILLMLGPEGGFSLEEIKKAEEAGFMIASLGPRILKAETAPIAACAIIQYIFGDIGNYTEKTKQ